MTLTTHPILAIVGPTATGKTAIAIALAQRLGNAELINADSRQLIRGLHVGTCTPTAAELGEVCCNLLNCREIDEEFTVAQWSDAARKTIKRLQQEDKLAILVGGTGLYITSLVKGWGFAPPATDTSVREYRNQLALTKEGREQLVQELQERDPEAFATIEIANHRRVIRALEILDAGAKSVDLSYQQHEPLQITRIGIDAPSPWRERFIEQRVHRFFESGELLIEVKNALAQGVSPRTLSQAGIGYSEALSVIAGQSVEKAIADTVGRTKKYAKAQRTWFRRDHDAVWLSNQGQELAEMVDQALEIVTSTKQTFA